MNLKSLIKLNIFSKSASSKEPVGPVLGQFGIPIVDFCKKFNNFTEKFEDNILLKVIIFNFGNQKYDFIVKFPEIFFFIKKVQHLNVKLPGHIIKNNICYITPYILYELLYYLNKNKELELTFSLFKKIQHSLKSVGFYILHI
jgi:ribosomal protein L11